MDHTIDFMNFSFHDLKHVEENFHSKSNLIDFSTLSFDSEVYVDAIIDLLDPNGFITKKQS